VIASLERGDFDKSMTTCADHRVWPDVYHAPTPVEDDAHIEFTLKAGAVA
jgi:motility quorum-sensing regulator/GCU-specific mRNA interferase toxin